MWDAGLEARWLELAEDVFSGMKEWRLAHPTASLREIEVALDERLRRVRAPASGALAVVQDADEALFPGMRRNAAEHVEVDFCLPAAKIGRELAGLSREAVREEAALPVSEEMDSASEVADALEAALWVALRALEEQAELARHIEARARDRGNTRVAACFEERAHTAEQRAALVREALLGEVETG